MEVSYISPWKKYARWEACTRILGSIGPVQAENEQEYILLTIEVLTFIDFIDGYNIIYNEHPFDQCGRSIIRVLLWKLARHQEIGW